MFQASELLDMIRRSEQPVEMRLLRQDDLCQGCSPASSAEDTYTSGDARGLF